VSSDWALTARVISANSKKHTGGLKTTIQASDVAPNQYAVNVKPVKAIQYNLTFQSNDAQLEGCPFVMSVTPSEASAAHCSLHDTAVLARVTAGTKHTFSLTCRDEFDNVRTSGGDSFEVFLNNVKSGTITDEGAGLYHISVDPTIAGRTEVSVRHDGKDVVGSPFIMDVQPSKAVATESQIVSNKVNRGIAGEDVSVIVECRDIYANVVIEGGAAELMVECTGSATVPGTMQDLGKGLHRATFRPTISGPYIFRAILSNAEIFEGVFEYRVEAAETCVKKSIVSHANEICVAGSQNQIQIRARDEFENDRLSGGDVVQLEFDGPGSASTHDNGDGTYTCSYVLTHAVGYSLRLSMNKSEMVGSPFGVECLPSKADGSKSVVLDGGVKSVVAGEEAKFVVEARDLYGNRVREGGSVVNVEVRGSSTSKTSVEDKGDGHFLCSFVETLAHSHEVCAFNLDFFFLKCYFSLFYFPPCRSLSP
jgi:hypothetical protein